VSSSLPARLTEFATHSDAVELLNNRQDLIERKTIEQFQAERSRLPGQLRLLLESEYSAAVSAPSYLRIGTNDFLGLYDLEAVFSQLSRLAIGLVRACLTLSARQPGIATGDFVVMAMGKLGGWELNYSSDIDLLFVAKNNAENTPT